MAPWTHFLALSMAVSMCHSQIEEKLSTLDASFCKGGLKVIYPELDISECLVIPQHLREKISTVWNAPEMYFSAVNEEKLYVLVMVDPDAKSRTDPEFAYWRHWLVADIQIVTALSLFAYIAGHFTQIGHVKGTTLTDYRPPTPPRKSGFHRYQFMLLEQPADAQVTLTEEEKSGRGKWNVDAFLKRVGLGAPLATLQYLTQNYRD